MIFKYLKILVMTFLSFFLSLNVFGKERSEYWQQRVALFDMLPIGQNDIVFLGNSITDGGEFNELLHNENIKNRGISGDVISGVMERLHQVTDGKPRMIFLMIGINDIAHNKSLSELTEEYENLVKAIRNSSPSSRLFIESVLPINNSFKRYKNLFGKEQLIINLNQQLKEISQENGADYIDLYSVFVDGKGNLKKDFTNDGLHLTGKGYHAWANAIKHLIDSNDQ